MRIGYKTKDEFFWYRQLLSLYVGNVLIFSRVSFWHGITHEMLFSTHKIHLLEELRFLAFTPAPNSRLVYQKYSSASCPALFLSFFFSHFIAEICLFIGKNIRLMLVLKIIFLSSLIFLTFLSWKPFLMVFVILAYEHSASLYLTFVLLLSFALLNRFQVPPPGNIDRIGIYNFASLLITLFCKFHFIFWSTQTVPNILWYETNIISPIIVG